MSIGPIATGSGPIRDVHLGRFRGPTILNDVSEAVGDALESVGGGVVPGERRARPLTLTLPLYGNATEADPYEAGLRMRRQMRSLMENTRLKLLTLYFQFSPDTELNGWLIIGGGEITLGEGGISFADFRLALSDCYKVGSRRTHRPARRVELYDRRLSTTARDVLGTVFSTDFSGLTALAVSYLPVGVTDVTGVGKRVVSFGSRASLGGSVPVVVGASHAEVLSFERPEASENSADDVVVYDRRGQSASSPLSWGARVLQDGPILFVRLGELPGATIPVDSSDSSLAGVYVGTPQLAYTPSAVLDTDTAAGLNGQYGIYARFADVSALSITGSISSEGWILPLAGTPNLVINPYGEAEVHPWTTSVTAITSPTLIVSTAWTFQGASSFRLQGTTSNATNTLTALSGIDGEMRATPSTNYTAQARIHVVAAGAGAQAIIRLRSLDAANASLSLTDSAPISISAGNDYTVSVTHATHASATQVRVEIILQNGANATAYDVYFDEVQVVAGSAAVASATLRPRFDSIVSKWRSTGTGRSYRFGYDWHFNQLVLEISTDGTVSGTTRRTFSLALATGVSVHIGFAYDSTTGTATFYRNGVVLGQSSGAAAGIFDSATSLTIGKWESD
jgi:hypothetical protein